MGDILAACIETDTLPDVESLRNTNRKNCKILGRGSCNDGHFSIEETTLRTEGWIELKELSQNVAKFKHLYKQYEGFMLINEKNEIFVCGQNRYNKLGIVNDEKSNDDVIKHLSKVPFDNESNGNPVLLSQGIMSKEHSFIYTSDNKLFANGKNWLGEFGNGKQSQKNVVFEEVDRFWKDDEKLTEIHCNTNASFFLTDLGNLYAVGSFSCVDADDHTSKPILIKENIQQIAVGIYSILLDKEGKLILHGQDDSSAEFVKPEIRTKICKFFNENEDLVIKSVHCGHRHGLILCENGQTFTFGNNQSGQIGNDKSISNGNKIVEEPFCVDLKKDSEHIVFADCGEEHCMALSNKNNLFIWGDNFGGRSGDDSWPPPKQVELPHYIDKEKDLKIGKNDKINMVIATNKGSIVVL